MAQSQSFTDTLDAKGASEEKIAERLSEMLSAETPIYDKQGNILFFEPDHKTRIRAAELLLQARKIIGTAAAAPIVVTKEAVIFFVDPINPEKNTLNENGQSFNPNLLLPALAGGVVDS